MEHGLFLYSVQTDQKLQMIPLSNGTVTSNLIQHDQYSALTACVVSIFFLPHLNKNQHVKTYG